MTRKRANKVKGATFKVKVGSGIYEIEEPVGRLGAKHFALLSRAAPEEVNKVPEDDMVQSKLIKDDTDSKPTPPKITREDKERMSEMFEQWSNVILPHIIVEGPYDYDAMPGKDQFALFNAVIMHMEGDDDSPELFQLLP